MGPEKHTGERCSPPIVYVESCCHHGKTPEVVRPERNGHSTVPFDVVTQLLPQVNGVAPVGKDVGSKEKRGHRQDEEGLNMHDLTLGILVGAGAAVFLVGLLMVLLFR